MIVLPWLRHVRRIPIDSNNFNFEIDFDDVPFYMQTTMHSDSDSQQCFDWYFEDVEKYSKTLYGEVFDESDRWKWIVDEMIFAFEQRSNYDTLYMQKRIDNGFRLFGKYFTLLNGNFRL